MKVLFVGDVVGEPGRRAVRHLVPKIREREHIDIVIANGENAAGGAGITVSTAAELFAGGVEVITTGDHLWDMKEVTTLLLNEPRFLRPLNYPPGTPGQGSTVVQKPNLPPLAVINAQGRVFMADLDDPFCCLEAEVEQLRQTTPLIFVDFHAEATSEKIALGRFLDGHVSAVVGTHTHVQTADEQIFLGGTAYLTDAGFTGPHDSVLGRKVDPVIKRFRTQMPQRFEVATGRVFLHGVIVEIDFPSGRSISIRRVTEPLSE